MIQYAAEIYVLVSLDKNLNLVPSMPHIFVSILETLVILYKALPSQF